MKLLAATALLAALASPAAATRPAPPPPLAGKWVMHIFVGDKLFDDQVTIIANAGFSGTLVVPKRFTATLENITATDDHFAFEIQANEGHGVFRVRYEGSFIDAPANNTFIGTARVTSPEPGLLGGFVGQRK
jgi:hypothetical protein